MKRSFVIALLVLCGTAAFGQREDAWKSLYDACRQNLEIYKGFVTSSRPTAFVLVIDTPDEVVTAVAMTEKAAVGELYKYVTKSWKSPVPIPADADDAVDQFFSSTDYDYEIREQPLIQRP